MEKIEAAILDATTEKSQPEVSGEALFLGYPFWLAANGGAADLPPTLALGTG